MPNLTHEKTGSERLSDFVEGTRAKLNGTEQKAAFTLKTCILPSYHTASQDKMEHFTLLVSSESLLCLLHIEWESAVV